MTESTQGHGMTHGLPGRVVVIEGPDGCGKDTQIDLVVKALKALYPGRKIVQTHEPWDVPESPDGMRIRRILKHLESEIDPGDGTIDAKKFQKLYVSDRYIHWVVLILKLLREEVIVICSRERMSTYAYGHAFGLDVEEIHSWHTLLPVPDIFVLIDTPAAICAKRMVERAKQRGEPLEFFEVEGKVERIMPSYRHIRDLGILPVVVIDGTGTRKDIHQRILREVLLIIERK